METTIFDLGKDVFFVHCKSMSEVVHLGLMVGVGSRNDEKDLSGMSHFIEHMWFKGTTTRDSMKIVEDVERYGGDFNAYTSKEETCVYVSILNKYSDVAFEVLSDVYFNSVFPQKELVKECDVICDEIYSYEDSPSELIFDDFEERFYVETDLSRPILGSKESIERINSSKMNDFYRNKFLRSKLVISFVGNIPFDDALAKVMSFFDFSCRVIDLLPNHKSILNGSVFSFLDKKKTNQAHCLLGCDAYSWTDSRRLTLSVLNNVLGGSQMSSLLNMVLREKNGLTYTVESNFTSFCDAGLFMIYFGTDVKKVDKCLTLIQSEFDRIKNSSLLTDKLSAFKDQLLGQLAMSYDNNQNIMLSQAKSVLVFGRVDSFSELSSKIISISEDQMLDVANDILCFEKMSFLKYY